VFTDPVLVKPVQQPPTREDGGHAFVIIRISTRRRLVELAEAKVMYEKKDIAVSAAYNCIGCVAGCRSCGRGYLFWELGR
jgi:hypothetical protein